MWPFTRQRREPVALELQTPPVEPSAAELTVRQQIAAVDADIAAAHRLGQSAVVNQLFEQRAAIRATLPLTPGRSS